MWLEKYFGKYTIKISHGILKEKSHSQCWLLFGLFSSHSLGSPSLALLFDHKDRASVYVLNLSNFNFLNINKTIERSTIFFLPSALRRGGLLTDLLQCPQHSWWSLRLFSSYTRNLSYENKWSHDFLPQCTTFNSDVFIHNWLVFACCITCFVNNISGG